MEFWTVQMTDGILKGYLEHTFQRVYEEGKILETREYAIFNTGLFNRYYQPVYAYFIPNLVPDRQRWYLEGFYTEYYLLKSGIVSLPKRAEYVKDPAELVFDTTLDILPQYEHIFEEAENNMRLPECIRNSGMKVQIFDGALRQTQHHARTVCILVRLFRNMYDHSRFSLSGHRLCLQNPCKR